MPSFATPRLVMAAMLAFWSAMCGAQTASSSGYVITPGQGTVGFQPQNPFAGSVPAVGAASGVLTLSLKDAVDRGLKQNLGLLLSAEGISSARGQWWKNRSQLLPNLTAESSVSSQQLNLHTFGISVPGIPSVVGPFGLYDTRANLTQSVFDWKSIEQTHSDAQQVRAAKYSYKDARELVIFAVTSGYLQTVADYARVDTATAQQATAEALYRQAEDQRTAGTTAKIDVLRSQVEFQTRQQQLISAQNDLAKQKIVLERVIGLPLGQEFTLSDTNMYSPAPGLSLEDARKRAYETRADYQSALAQLGAAELTRKAAVAGYYPSLSTALNYGDVGVTADGSHGTVNAMAALQIPIFQGGRVHGDVLQAEAALRQSRELLANLRAQIDQDVRNAFLDLQSASRQVEVARSSVDLANQTLEQARDRFATGVTDNIEVVQAQESVASASESLISSLYTYNLAKVELGRATGQAEASVQQLIQGR
jgi:outer membrane protein TolC